MSAIEILYATKTGHSQKLAQTIGKALNVKAKDLKDDPDLKDAEMLFIVSGIYGGTSMPQLIENIKNLDKGMVKQAAIITSCASGKQKQTKLRQLLEDKGIKVLDEFICKGAFLFVAMKHPNSQDFQAATDFAIEIINRRL